MAIEEITLSAVGDPDRWNDATADNGNDERGATAGTREMAAFARAYVKAARARNRFAFTRRGQERRRERFDKAAKTIVKSIATEAARVVVDRPARLEVRTRIYSGVMVLTKAVSVDQLKLIDRSRRRMRWSLALAGIGLAGISWTLIQNGMLPWPWW